MIVLCRIMMFIEAGKLLVTNELEKVDCVARRRQLDKKKWLTTG